MDAEADAHAHARPLVLGTVADVVLPVVITKKDEQRTESTLTPTITNLTKEQHLTKETKETVLDNETFVDNLDNESYGTINSLEDNILLTTWPANNNSFQTATGELHRTNWIIQYLQMRTRIKEMMATIFF
jgi:hypothetical protein